MVDSVDWSQQNVNNLNEQVIFPLNLYPAAAGVPWTVPQDLSNVSTLTVIFAGLYQTAVVIEFFDSSGTVPSGLYVLYEGDIGLGLGADIPICGPVCTITIVNFGIAGPPNMVMLASNRQSSGLRIFNIVNQVLSKSSGFVAGVGNFLGGTVSCQGQTSIQYWVTTTTLTGAFGYIIFDPSGFRQVHILADTASMPAFSLGGVLLEATTILPPGELQFFFTPKVVGAGTATIAICSAVGQG